MDRRSSRTREFSDERRRRSQSSRFDQGENGVRTHTRRDHAKPPPSAYRPDQRRRSTGYATEQGLSPEKLRALNRQLGWSSEGDSRSSKSTRPLRVDKRRYERRQSIKHGKTELRKRSAEQKAEAEVLETGNDDYHSPNSIRKVTDDFYYREKPGHYRVTSGQALIASERARHPRSRGEHRKHHRRRSYGVEKGLAKGLSRRKKWIAIGICIVLVLVLIIGLAAGLASRKHNGAGSTAAANSSLASISPDTIPEAAKGTYLDPFTWFDTTDFNLTYTNDTVGGLSIMGLNTSYENSVQANPAVSSLGDAWPYPDRPVRGVNVGGWLSLEPFITPSLFNTTSSNMNTQYHPPYPDEWTLSTALGPAAANGLLDKHYSQFVNQSTFEQIRDAGFDHVRIPFPYWAVATYDGDPYVPHTSWRYLLRGIEYARQNGLRVCLDLHSAPGSQNGWNHSGRQGILGWLNGTDGQLNAERTLQIHQQLSAFFAQDRYKGLVTMYGILNEPRMYYLNADEVVNWTATAIRQLRSSELSNDTVLVISDGFEPLPFWHSAFDAYPDIIPNGSNASAQRLLLDSHEYVIFNRDQLKLNHTSKLNFACTGWSQQVSQSMSPASDFGSFISGEWSIADTDCASLLTPEGTGNRWEGSLKTDNVSTTVLQPSCPLADEERGDECSCNKANADPSQYSDGYKTWLSHFADAQIQSFNSGWGFFYWNWDVEDSVAGGVQWSWKKGREAGILPQNVAEGGDRLWECDNNGGEEEDWQAIGLDELY
ncbi:MAG: hypothetical protein Q9162_006460 [Coniocarpon cinnabarinum]